LLTDQTAATSSKDSISSHEAGPPSAVAKLDSKKAEAKVQTCK
jgi:hypothetical protein